MMKTLTILAFVTLMLFSQFADASNFSVKTDIVVNGDIITNLQIEQRFATMKSAMLSAMPQKTISEEEEKTLREEAKSMLIEESLMKQEAERKNVTLSDYDIKYAISDLERKNNVEAGRLKEFFESKGLNYEAALQQIKAGLIQKKLISVTYRDEMSISDGDIAMVKKQLQDFEAVVHYQLSEIIIPIGVDGENSAKEKIKEIKQKFKEGKDFSNLALSYSLGKTANNGGLIGWVKEQDIFPNIKKQVVALDIGQITDAIEFNGVYMLIYVNDKKVFDPANDNNFLQEQAINEKFSRYTKALIDSLRKNAIIEEK